jgi:peptide/nickel transport system permease protein
MFTVIVIAFLLIHLAPGDPTMYFVSQQAVDPEYLARVRAEMGLDKPLHIQFYIYLTKLLQGDFGYSYTYSAPALKVVLDKLPRTLLLMGFALTLAIVLGIIIGVEAARRANTRWDYLMTTVSLAGYSIPVFWLGLMIMVLFAVYLPWFPTTGQQIATLGSEAFTLRGVLVILRHLFLPGMTLALSLIALTSRLTRQGTLDALSENYVLTARMKGLSDRAIAYRHAFRNAVLPVVTIIGMSFGFFISWSVLVEIVFGWPGLGLLLWTAVLNRDYPILMTLFIVISVMTVLGNLAADIMNAKLDPRISAG